MRACRYACAEVSHYEREGAGHLACVVVGHSWSEGGSHVTVGALAPSGVRVNLPVNAEEVGYHHGNVAANHSVNIMDDQAAC